MMQEIMDLHHDIFFFLIRLSFFRIMGFFSFFLFDFARVRTRWIDIQFHQRQILFSLTGPASI